MLSNFLFTSLGRPNHNRNNVTEESIEGLQYKDIEDSSLYNC